VRGKSHTGGGTKEIAAGRLRPSAAARESPHSAIGRSASRSGASADVAREVRAICGPLPAGDFSRGGMRRFEPAVPCRALERFRGPLEICGPVRTFRETVSPRRLANLTQGSAFGGVSRDALPQSCRARTCTRPICASAILRTTGTKTTQNAPRDGPFSYNCR